ncbi:MAG: HIT family protein [Hyphomicrobiales bacterium]
MTKLRSRNPQAMSNPTMLKFGFPGTLVHDYKHWSVLLRPAQATLGALVLVCKDPAQAFSAISPAAFAELERVTGDIERALSAFRPYQKINYLMLMMVDKDVHFHVLPRYETTQTFEGETFPDPGWPAVPDLSQAVKPDDAIAARLIGELQRLWAV